jgi:4a-hydroxytetrahydrobiopterin dehydratase
MVTKPKKVVTTPKLTLSDKRRIKKLGELWHLDDKAKKLTAQFEFKNYIEAFMFVTRLTVHAEVMQHHPEINLTYGKVKLILSTHDAKGVTIKDIELAEAANRVLSTRLASDSE